MKRPITKEALELIEHFEGFYERPYLDPVGIPTIGIGTVAYENGQKVKLTDPPITKDRAYNLLMWELEEKADTVHNFLLKSAIILNIQQYSALVSFAYNCGCGPIIDSGRSLNEAIKSDNIIKMADAFLLYDKATTGRGIFRRTITLKGLTRRRKAERYLFLNGVNNFYA